MASTIKVDNVQNQPGNNLINRCSATTTIGSGAGNTVVVCGATVTIGRCGGTVALATGATQTGFGASGAVSWVTGSIKTTGFTAVSGSGYFCNTTGGAFTATLPASPSAGDIVGLADYAGTAASNKITIGRNSSKIEGNSNDGEISVARQAVTLVYVDGTQGWVPIGENDSSFDAPKYVTATVTGACNSLATADTNYKVATFVGPGTLCVSCVGNANGNNKIDYMIVAGGGGGRGPGGYETGGGGGGGFREARCANTSGCWTSSPLAAGTSLSATPGAMPVTVGAGGANNTVGGNSSFSTITSGGGGAGGCAGGSGGGGGAGGAGAAGNTPPVSPPQGNAGGSGSSSPPTTGGGGGGAGSVGTTGQGGNGDGGDGIATMINGTNTTRAGGGGGSPNGDAGPGGGGAGATPPHPKAGSAGTVNTGGGGGAGYNGTGGAGGSGIIILRYKFQ